MELSTGLHRGRREDRPPAGRKRDFLVATDSNPVGWIVRVSMGVYLFRTSFSADQGDTLETYVRRSDREVLSFYSSDSLHVSLNLSHWQQVY